MRTATVRDLRNHFAAVAKWIGEGERVAITFRGKAFATLSPARMRKQVTIDWAKRLAERPGVGRKVGKRETEAFWKTLRD
jgi:antitoxin (DNA-binding transcriptional repressor) of toxin-antitoxin stability system